MQTKNAGWLGLLLALAGCGPSLTPEVYLIPAHYEGPLFVQYSQAGYPSLPRAGDSLVFDFRQGQVVRTSSPLVVGSGASDSFRYYYVDASGRRTQIRKVVDVNELRQQLPQEPCVVVSAGQVSKNLVTKFLTSARNYERNDTAGTQLFDKLLAKDTLSTSLR